MAGFGALVTVPLLRWPLVGLAAFVLVLISFIGLMWAGCGLTKAVLVVGGVATILLTVFWVGKLFTELFCGATGACGAGVVLAITLGLVGAL